LRGATDIKFYAHAVTKGMIIIRPLRVKVVKENQTARKIGYARCVDLHPAFVKSVTHKSRLCILTRSIDARPVDPFLRERVRINSPVLSIKFHFKNDRDVPRVSAREPDAPPVPLPGKIETNKKPLRTKQMARCSKMLKNSLFIGGRGKKRKKKKKKEKKGKKGKKEKKRRKKERHSGRNIGFI